MFRPLRTLGLAVPILVLCATTARAWIPIMLPDVIRLRTGETVKGRVVAEKSNEAVVTVEDYARGGTREFTWDVLTEDDKFRIQVLLGIVSDIAGDLSVECWVVTIRQAGGDTTEVRALIVNEDATAIWLRFSGQKDPLRIEKSRVVSREKDVCDPTEVKQPEELAAEMKAKLVTEESARKYFQWAQYCERVGAYVEAKEGYDYAATDETFLNRTVAQAASARMASLIADKEARADLSDIKNLIAFTQWKTVRERIEAFPTKHPQASEAVLKALETVKALFETKRKAWFSDQAGKQFVPIVKRMIEQKVRPKEAAINDVLGWARKDLVDESLEELTKRFAAKDPVVNAEETRSFWDGRAKKPNVWSTAKYGSGSFLIEPPKVKPPTNQPRPSGNRSGSGGGNAPQMQIPKPPTRDTWWEKADTTTRADWTFASFVENSGLFEVSPQKDHTNCTACEGQGLITKTTSSGGALSYLCPRCGGSRYDVIVKYH